jgi:two-component sensor histidine kinase
MSRSKYLPAIIALTTGSYVTGILLGLGIAPGPSVWICVGALLVALLQYVFVQQMTRARNEARARVVALEHERDRLAADAAALQAQLAQFNRIRANLPGLIYRVVLHPNGQISFPPTEQRPDDPHPQALHWLERIHPEDRASFYELLQHSAQELAPFDLEQRVVSEGGEPAWVRNLTWPARQADGTVVWDGVVLDISTQKQVEQNLQRSLREKDVLLQEIHHRVKNNLQVIASLLDLQALTMQDAQTRAVLAESQQRVQVMALVHQQLYHSSDLAQIDFASYVRMLVDYLAQLHRASTGAVRIELEIDELQIDTDTAIPYALIINELVTNALRHAFPEGRGGRLRVSCRLRDQATLELTVSDDGVGLPGDYARRQNETLGINLVATLARQIRGSVSVTAGEQGRGTSVQVTGRLRRGS